MTQNTKAILFVHGEPGHGKSTLAKGLEKHHGFTRFSLDEEYVRFIKDNCPEIYFDALSHYIWGHYNQIVRYSDYSIEKCRRDFRSEWIAHLRGRIIEISKSHDKIVVEGYVLCAVDNNFKLLVPDGVRFFGIQAHNRAYSFAGKSISIPEIAALGE